MGLNWKQPQKMNYQDSNGSNTQQTTQQLKKRQLLIPSRLPVSLDMPLLRRLRHIFGTVRFNAYRNSK